MSCDGIFHWLQSCVCSQSVCTQGDLGCESNMVHQNGATMSFSRNLNSWVTITVMVGNVQLMEMYRSETRSSAFWKGHGYPWSRTTSSLVGALLLKTQFLGHDMPWYFCKYNFENGRHCHCNSCHTQPSHGWWYLGVASRSEPHLAPGIVSQLVNSNGYAHISHDGDS